MDAGIQGWVQGCAHRQNKHERHAPSSSARSQMDGQAKRSLLGGRKRAVERRPRAGLSVEWREECDTKAEATPTSPRTDSMSLMRSWGKDPHAASNTEHATLLPHRYCPISNSARTSSSGCLLRCCTAGAPSPGPERASTPIINGKRLFSRRARSSSCRYSGHISAEKSPAEGHKPTCRHR